MNWYVKAFSALTKVSVRTLHHYDDIGLLKPSLRSTSGYRLYSEHDLLKLQHIVALKFFGFSLAQIKTLLKEDSDVLHHLKLQKQNLDEKTDELHLASRTINAIIDEISSGKSIGWSKVITLIKVFTMSKDLSKTWAGQVYSPDQLKQFAELKQRFSDQQMKDYEKGWELLIAKVKKQMEKDSNPESAVAQQLAKEWMERVDSVYGDFPELKEATGIAYKFNKIPDAPFDRALYDYIHAAVKIMGNKKQ